MTPKRITTALLALVLTFITSAAAMASEKDWAMGPFIRPVDKPIIAPTDKTEFKDPMTGKILNWEKSDTFNPAATVYNDKVYVLYRAEDGSGQGIGGHTSRIGVAISTDGVYMQRRSKPVLYPDNDDQKGYEWYGGVEDPRLVQGPDGMFYIYYTMWNRDNPEGVARAARIGVASSKDLLFWEKHGPIFAKAYDGKFAKPFHKAASVITELVDGKLVAAKINGKYWMYWGEDAVRVATSDDLINWTPVINEKGDAIKLITPRKDKFDSLLTEVGPPAVKTDKGIVLIYNGKNSGADKSVGKGAYAAGQLLLDKDDPTKVLDRLEDTFFKPEMEFEKTGQYTDGTVFVEGLVFYKQKWFLYYGTADSYVGVAIWDPTK